MFKNGEASPHSVIEYIPKLYENIFIPAKNIRGEASMEAGTGVFVIPRKRDKVSPGESTRVERKNMACELYSPLPPKSRPKAVSKEAKGHLYDRHARSCPAEHACEAGCTWRASTPANPWIPNKSTWE
jgi:hypothetical protein